FSLTLRGNPGHARSAPKPFDPPPVRVTHPDARVGGESTTGQVATAPGAPSDVAQPGEQPDWGAIASALRSNAGIRVDSISRKGGELFIDGYQTRYPSAAKGLGRAGRILSSSLGDEYD